MEEETNEIVEAYCELCVFLKGVFMNIVITLEAFLLNEVVAGLDKESLAPDEDLLSQGIIDSMGILQLAAFIEKEFAVKLKDDDMVPENFVTLNSLKEFIEHKKSSR
jgi:acyl carrier protein